MIWVLEQMCFLNAMPTFWKNYLLFSMSVSYTSVTAMYVIVCFSDFNKLVSYRKMLFKQLVCKKGKSSLKELAILSMKYDSLKTYSLSIQKIKVK